jgi:hypothetical protein
VIVTFDRLRTGRINVFVEGHHLAQESVALVASSKVAQEIWVNSRDFGTLDTGYRGWISRLKMYAEPLALEDAVVEFEFLRPSQCNEILSDPISFVPEADRPNAVVDLSRKMSSLPVPGSRLSIFGSSTSSLSPFFLMSVLIVIYFVWRRGVFKPLSGILTSSRAAKGGSWY